MVKVEKQEFLLQTYDRQKQKIDKNKANYEVGENKINKKPKKQLF